MRATQPEGGSQSDARQEALPSRCREALGRWGEEHIRAHLISRGYEIEAARWARAPLGELDLVAAKGPLLCFVEVRTRLCPPRGVKNWVEPAESVSLRKQRRLARTAEAYLLARRGARRDYLRFDVAALWALRLHGEGGYEPASLHYIEDAFQVPWAF